METNLDTSSKPALILSASYITYKIVTNLLGYYNQALDLVIITGTAIIVVATAIEKAPIIIKAIKKLFKK